ncbi:flagellar protein FlgN [Natranaerobius trueperi]|nr:flagellar protein FlgN [Natranaerobius trueperi]
MSNLFKKLADNLEEQLATYELLIHYGEKKQQILVNGHIDELEPVVKQEQKAVFQNSELEKQRLEIISHLAEILQEKEDNLTLSKIIDYASSSEKARLESTFNSLENIITTLKDLNFKNHSLIEQSLSYINFSLDIVSGAGKEDPGTYSSNIATDSNKTTTGNKNFLDKKM